MDEQRDFVETVPSFMSERTASNYRLFYLNRERHIERGVDLKFHSDGEALAYVKTIGSEHGVELWEGSRLVREFLPGE